MGHLVKVRSILLPYDFDTQQRQRAFQASVEQAQPKRTPSIEQMNVWTTETADFLLSPAGRSAAAALSGTALEQQHTLSTLATLRRTYSPEEAGALLTLARLRQKAVGKFPHPDQLFFVPEALEQATAWPIAQRRAAQIAQHAPAGPLLDLGCGIGGDLLALAQQRPVIAYESDQLRLRFAQANAELFGLHESVDFRQADWTSALADGVLPEAAAAFADPARRINERRVFSLHEMQPPFSAMLRLQRQLPLLVVKVMPGLDMAELEQTLPPELLSHCCVEFVSHDATCKEAVIWLGGVTPWLAPPAAEQVQRIRRVASVHTGAEWQTLVASGASPPLGELAVGQFLHEPDPAVIRAGAFAELCVQLDAHLFDQQIAYLVSSAHSAHPLTQAFEIEEILPFGLKQLNRRLQALQIQHVEIKKRGAPIEPEQMRARLKLVKSGRDAVVIFTRRGNERIILICRRVSQKGTHA